MVLACNAQVQVIHHGVHRLSFGEDFILLSQIYVFFNDRHLCNTSKIANDSRSYKNVLVNICLCFDNSDQGQNDLNDPNFHFNKTQ